VGKNCNRLNVNTKVIFASPAASLASLETQQCQSRVSTGKNSGEGGGEGDLPTFIYPFEMLCLHGSQQTAEIFRTRLGKLEKKLGCDYAFVYAEGPVQLPLKPGDDVPLRAWLCQGDDALKQSCVDVLAAIWGQHTLKGILGFSQGALVAALLAAKHADLFPGLEFVVLIGAPDSSQSLHPVSSRIQSLHLGGRRDALVPVAESRGLADRLFSNPLFVEHSEGHSLPNDLGPLVSFIQDRMGSSGDRNDTASEGAVLAQSEELETLQAIYADKIEVESFPAVNGPPAVVSIALYTDSIDSLGSKERLWSENIRIKFSFPPRYLDPASSSAATATVPVVSLVLGKLSMADCPTRAQRSLLACCRKAAASEEGCDGTPLVFAIFSAAQEWLLASPASWESCDEANPEAEGVAEAEEEVEEERGRRAWYLSEPDENHVKALIEAASKQADDIAAERRRRDPSGRSLSTASSSNRQSAWVYKVGLVGKPSAGKSTFFNAVTQAALDREGRKVAQCSPHPFTTIEPNIASGWWVANESDVDQGVVRGSRYGRCPSTNRRLLPVVVKDVAGLVPGAYSGRGKGNKFLNDLVDCDVLLHVVDASGLSDRDGNIIVKGSGDKGSSAAEDAKWVREELHRWISGNIIAKWPSVCSRKSRDKTSARILQLFTGYHTTSNCVEEAASRAGLSLDQGLAWGPEDVHNLVAHFLKVRFPIALALNKVDLLDADSADQVVGQNHALATGMGEVATPCSAHGENLRLAGKDTDPVVVSTLQKFGCLGVLESISAAVSLRPPLLVYPVSDADSEAGLGGGEKCPDCILMKPGSTVLDCFEALKRGAVEGTRLQGEFVRAEARSLDPTSRKKLLGRDAELSADYPVLRIMSNRKSVWQEKNN